LFVLGDGVQFVSKLLYVLIGELSNVDEQGEPRGEIIFSIEVSVSIFLF